MMAVNSYIDEKDGKEYWTMYVNIRSQKDSKIRKQKRINGIDSEEKALKLEKSWIKKCTDRVKHEEHRGICWGDVVDIWFLEAEQGYFKEYSPHTLRTYRSAINLWTEDWLDAPAAELTKADGKDILLHAKLSGLSKKSVTKIKGTVNTIYNWGIVERLIQGVHISPVYGINLNFGATQDKVPLILTKNECITLLTEARDRQNPWYYIWAFVLNAACRNGECYALLKSDVDISQRLIKVTKGWNYIDKKPKSTKTSEWRNLYINDFLLEVIKDLFRLFPDSPYLLPRIKSWGYSAQAAELRKFCDEIGIRSVTFHTLRACWATHTLAEKGLKYVEQIMAMGGWKDRKTFQVYIRLAGLDVKGVTDGIGMAPSQTNGPDKNILNFSSKGIGGLHLVD